MWVDPSSPWYKALRRLVSHPLRTTYAQPSYSIKALNFLSKHLLPDDCFNGADLTRIGCTNHPLIR